MTGDIDTHAQLKQKGGPGIECAQSGEQAHCSAPVSQHVQHGTKPGTLAQRARSMTVHSVQQTYNKYL